jgi:FkbM family methyltransferase
MDHSLESWVDALYERLLLRPADAASRDEKAGRLRLGRASPVSILEEFVRSDEFRANLRQFVATTGAEVPFTNNVSQFDEIGMLVREMVNAGTPNFVVDVGARGLERSNSWDLMRHFGWRGLLIEANPALKASIESSFAGLPFKLICCAVSDYAGRAEFTLGTNDDVSSLNPEAAAGWGAPRGRIAVPVRRLGKLLEMENVPLDFGLLSIDIEGEDIKVLNDLILTSLHRPRYIIIEASYEFATKSLDDLPISAEVSALYEIIGQTRANLLLRKKNS